MSLNFSSDKEKMSSYQPKSLEDTALQKIVIMIFNSAMNTLKMCHQVDGANVEESADTKSLIEKSAEDIDAFITEHLHDLVTYHSLKHILLQDKEEFFQNESNILQLLLRCHVTKFNFYSWPSKMHDLLFKSLGRLKYLKHLILPSRGLRKNLTYVIRAVTNMKNLESYRCSICPYDLLKVLCENCPLKSLNIRHSFLVTDESVVSILILQNLTQLDIFGNSISIESCLRMLLGLPQLVDVSCKQLAISLAEINDDNVILPFQSVECVAFSPPDLVNLAKYCPFITKLHISMQQIVDLSHLISLRHLKCLTVFSDYSYYSQVKTLLHGIGHQITELDLRIGDVSEETVKEIKILCPKLRKLVLNYELFF